MYLIVAMLAVAISGQNVLTQPDQPFLTRMTAAQGIDLDAFCLAAAENGRNEFKKLSAEEQSKLDTFSIGILGMIVFYSGGTSARRTNAEQLTEKNKASSYLASRPVGEQQEAVRRCHDDMVSRTNVIAKRPL